ncbi:extracellular solute-binding protein [Gorillibacterium massiliense]|uniref:extracellular solute-binding protein n=1 Tax=Gorillibacterium massiliense TaxID=1280390 RepID=UPI001EE17EFF|nr:extracellular solute-binding protein [Gorillibacterium massiliense]
MSLAMAVFTACSNGGNTGQSSQSTNESAAPKTTNLSMFTFTEEVQSSLTNSPVWKKLMENANVNINLQVISGTGADEKRSVMIASGEYPDILDRIDEHFVDAGALIPLDDLIDKYGPNIKKAWGDSLNKLRNPKDNKIYFLPSPKNRPEEIVEPGGTLLVQYDVLEKTGYPKLKTLDDVYNMLMQYTAENKEIDGKPFIPWGLWADSWGYNQTVNNPALWVNGFTDDSDAYVDQKTFDVTYFNTTDYFKNYLKFLNKLYKSNLLDKNGFITKYDEFNSQVSSGRVLAMIYNAGLINEDEAALRQAGMPERAYARFPIVAEAGIQDRSQVYSESYDTGMGISVNCKDPVAAIKFMDYLLSDEGNILLNWGIEGVHYDIVDGKRVQKPEVTKKWNSDPAYRWQQGLNSLTWWPQYNGAIKLDDGDYASPFNTNAIYNSYDDETKNVLKQYGVKYWGQLFDTTGTRTPYGFAWTIPIESGSKAELASTKANELRHIVVGDIVMSQDDATFESKWTAFVKKLQSESKIGDWEKAMSEAIQTRLKLWGIQQ